MQYDSKFWICNCKSKWTVLKWPNHATKDIEFPGLKVGPRVLLIHHHQKLWPLHANDALQYHWRFTNDVSTVLLITQANNPWSISCGGTTYLRSRSVFIEQSGKEVSAIPKKQGQQGQLLAIPSLIPVCLPLCCAIWGVCVGTEVSGEIVTLRGTLGNGTNGAHWSQSTRHSGPYPGGAPLYPSNSFPPRTPHT